MLDLNKRIKNFFFKKRKEDRLKKTVEKKQKTEKKPALKKQTAFSFNNEILKCFYNSEKAEILARDKNQYVFGVAKSANKSEIKKAIENLYKVSVLKVNIINLKRKQKQIRGKVDFKVGFKKGIKKAIVKIKEGEKIEL